MTKSEKSSPQCFVIRLMLLMSSIKTIDDSQVMKMRVDIFMTMHLCEISDRPRRHNHMRWVEWSLNVLR